MDIELTITITPRQARLLERAISDAKRDKRSSWAWNPTGPLANDVAELDDVLSQINNADEIASCS